MLIRSNSEQLILVRCRAANTSLIRFNDGRRLVCTMAFGDISTVTQSVGVEGSAGRTLVRSQVFRLEFCSVGTTCQGGIRSRAWRPTDERMGPNLIVPTEQIRPETLGFVPGYGSRILRHLPTKRNKSQCTGISLQRVAKEQDQANWKYCDIRTTGDENHYRMVMLSSVSSIHSRLYVKSSST